MDVPAPGSGHSVRGHVQSSRGERRAPLRRSAGLPPSPEPRAGVLGARRETYARRYVRGASGIRTRRYSSVNARSFPRREWYLLYIFIYIYVQGVYNVCTVHESFARPSFSFPRRSAPEVMDCKVNRALKARTLNSDGPFGRIYSKWVRVRARPRVHTPTPSVGGGGGARGGDEMVSRR